MSRPSATSPGARQSAAGAPAAPRAPPAGRRPWRRRCRPARCEWRRVTSCAIQPDDLLARRVGAELYVKSLRPDGPAPRASSRSTPACCAASATSRYSAPLSSSPHPSARGDRAADRALAGAGGAVDGEDRYSHAHSRRRLVRWPIRPTAPAPRTPETRWPHSPHRGSRWRRRRAGWRC